VLASLFPLLPEARRAHLMPHPISFATGDAGGALIAAARGGRERGT
jgi:hypothetical protein